MVVWVHFPGLPRAKFARMAVEVDLSKPVLPRIRLDGRWQKFDYENLPVVCFECGKVGHTNVSFPTLDRGPYGEADRGSLASAVIVVGDSTPEANAGFGPWMIVSRKSQRNQKVTATIGKLEQVLVITNGPKKGDEPKESDIAGKSSSQKSAKSQQKQRQQIGENQTMKREGKSKGNSKWKGKVTEQVGHVEKGLFGPKPNLEEASSTGPSHTSNKAISPTPQDMGSRLVVSGSSGSIGKGPVLDTLTGPATQIIAGGNGSKIHIVETQPYQPHAPRLVNPEMPPAVSRTKSKKEGREKKGRNKEKRVSLTLQQIKEWTKATKPKAVAEVESMKNEEAKKMVMKMSGIESTHAAPGL
ncbi:unnamed protein product [Linum trigynum]|uniref:CCHC-type domain-containing protein n=1 Tax=Linum trigynum TaxID=586398 RepID=A0AAV2G724_9ROSI